LPYNEQQSFSGAIGTDYLYNLNSAFDPSRTGVGHQPYGFDQWTPSLYTRYIVLTADVEIDFCNNSTVPVVVGFAGTNNTTSLALAFDELAEQPLSSDIAVLQSNAGGNSTARLRRKFNLWEMAGRSKQQYLTELTQYGADYNASPGELQILHIGATSLDGSSNATVLLNVKIIYEVMLLNRSMPSGS